MHLQADLTGIPVLRTQAKDAATLGAAMCAAQAEGVNAIELKPEKRFYKHAQYDTFCLQPLMKSATTDTQSGKSSAT